MRRLLPALLLPAVMGAQGAAPAALEELVVTVARTPLFLGGSGLAITVLEGEGARRGRRFVGPAEALAFIPGVVVRDRGDRALEPRLAIRGAGARANFGARGIVVLVDGVPATLADGQAPLTFLDLDLADRIEVARGPLAALHGNGAGGVVAISTPARPAGSRELRAAASGGSHGGLDLMATAGVGGPRLGGLLAATRRSTDGVRAHAAARQYRVQGGLEWLPAAGTRVTLRGRYADDPLLEAPGALTAAEFAADPWGANPAAITRAAGKTVRQRQLSLAVAHRGRWATGEVTTWVLGRELHNPLALSPEGGSDPRDGTLVEVDREVAGVRAAATAALGGGLRLTAGIDLQRQADDRRNSVHRAGVALPGTGFLDQRQVVTSLGPFVQAVVPVAKGTALRAGLRHDRVGFTVTDRLDGAAGGRRTMAAWSASAAIARRQGPVESWLGAATAFETPTTTELAGQQDGRTGINDLLDPARAVSIEAGLRVRQLGGDLELVAWRVATRDAITPAAAVDGRTFYDNIGGTTLRGIEGTLGTRLRGGWHARLTGSLLDGRFGDDAVDGEGIALDGRRLPGIPRTVARVGLSGPIGAVMLDLDHAWSGGLDADDRNTRRVAGWGAGITSLAVRWPAGGGVDLFGAVHNLLNRAHVASVVVNGFGGRVIEPGSGRLLSVGAEFRLAPR